MSAEQWLRLYYLEMERRCIERLWSEAQQHAASTAEMVKNPPTEFRVVTRMAGSGNCCFLPDRPVTKE